jgi:hypothetical protein
MSRGKRLMALTWLAMALALLSVTRPSSGADTAAPATQLRGIWESEAWADVTEAGRPVGGIARVKAKSVLNGHPPYNAEWEARHQLGLKDPALKALSAISKVCSFGFPGVMESPALFKLVVTPEETLFVFMTPEVRNVYTDGRRHPAPADLWPTPMGESVGHWEGETLVIETIARRATAPIRVGSPLSVLSDQARFTERIRLVSPDRLENEMTIDDPIAFERPWVLKLQYRRVTDLDRLPPHDCAENDRNPIIDGKLTIAPP